jgi:uncharacterized protein HemX
MVGILQIMTYLFCLYLVYKGVEIFQIALTSSNDKSRHTGIGVGIVAIMVALGAAAFFVNWVNQQAESIQNSLPFNR